MIIVRAFAFAATVAVSLGACSDSGASCDTIAVDAARNMAIGCFSGTSYCPVDYRTTADFAVEDLRSPMYRNCGHYLELAQRTTVDQGEEFIFRCNNGVLNSEVRVTLFTQPIEGFGCRAATAAFFSIEQELPVGEATQRVRYGP